MGLLSARTAVARLWHRRWLLPHLLVPSLPFLLLAVLVPVDVLMTRHGNDLNLYYDVSRRMLGGELPYRDFPVEYPPLALSAFVLPRLLATDPTLSIDHYVLLFALENALLVLGVSLVLLRLCAHWRPRRRVAMTLATWALLVIVTAPIVPWRYDLLPAFLTLLGVLSALLGGPLAAGLWLGLGAAAKLYPAALLPLLFLGYVALRDRRSATLLVGGFAAGAIVPLLPFLVADPDSALSFLSYLGERGIQLESLPAGIIGLARTLGLIDASVIFASGSWQVETPLASTILRLGTLLLVAGMVGALALAYRRFRAEALATGDISAPTLVGQALALLLLVVGLGKVFSPQYVAWLLPFLPLLAWRQLALGVAICLLTVAIYPLLFADSLVGMEPTAVLALNLRNGAVLGLAAWLLFERLPRWVAPAPAPATLAPSSAPYRERDARDEGAAPRIDAPTDVAAGAVAVVDRRLDDRWRALRSALADPRTLGVGAGIAGAISLTWFVPALAVVTVWPAMLFVPGWLLLRWARVRVGPAAFIGLAVALSVAVSTHLVFWLGHLPGGYARPTTFLAALLMSLPAAPAIARLIDRLPAVRGAARRAIGRDRVGLLLGAAAALLIGGILGSTIWVVDDAGVTTSWVNWSDLLVHLSIAQSLNAGNFPPEVPYYAGAALNYHWFSDFHGAILASAAGIFAAPAFVVDSALLAGALALVVYGLARHFLRERRAAALAVALVVVGGGMGYLRFFGDWATGVDAPLTLLTQNGYDHRWNTEWPFFRIPSVFATGLLPHRATTAGLPMLCAAILLLAVGLRPRWRRGVPDNGRAILLAGVLCAALAPFHFFFFPAGYLLALAYAVASGRLVERRALGNAARFLAPVLLALPFVVAPLLTFGGSGTLRLDLWWDAPSEDGPLATLFFYATNLGVPFALALAALLVRRLGPWRWFLGAWIALLFAIPNVVIFSYVSFDMNKYFQAMWIAVALLAAWLIRRWPIALLVPALALSVASPAQTALYAVASRAGLLGLGDLEAAAWAASSTPQRSIFVTDGWIHSFTDVAGRLRLHSYLPYIANLGYDTTQRVGEIHEIYCGGDAARSAQVMAELGADYVVSAAPGADCEGPVDFASAPQFALAFENGALRVWQRRG